MSRAAGYGTIASRPDHTRPRSVTWLRPDSLTSSICVTTMISASPSSSKSNSVGRRGTTRRVSDHSRFGSVVFRPRSVPTPLAGEIASGATGGSCRAEPSGNQRRWRSDQRAQTSPPLELTDAIDSPSAPSRHRAGGGPSPGRHERCPGGQHREGRLVPLAREYRRRRPPPTRAAERRWTGWSSRRSRGPGWIPARRRTSRGRTHPTEPDQPDGHERRTPESFECAREAPRFSRRHESALT